MILSVAAERFFFMLTERRLKVVVRAQFVEWLALMEAAQQKAGRLMEIAVARWMKQYLEMRLTEATVVLSVDIDALGNVLAEMLLIATREDEIVGWSPLRLCHGDELKMPLKNG